MMATYQYGDITIKGIKYTGKGSSSAAAVSNWTNPNGTTVYYWNSAGTERNPATSSNYTTLWLMYFYGDSDGTNLRKNSSYYIGWQSGGGAWFVSDEMFPSGRNAVAYSVPSGISAPSSQTKIYGTGLAIADAVTRTGYTFSGWKSSKTGAVYAAGSTITDTEYTTYLWNASSPTLTLTAQWTINTYTITLDANGGSIPATSGWNGSGSTATKGVTYNSTIGALPTPTRTGYTFNGWFTQKTGGTQVNQNTVITDSKTFYAHWTLSTYTYTFNPNNGVSGASQTVTRDNGQTIIKADGTVDGVSSPTRTGYLFKGWNTSSSATTALTSITATGTYAKDMTFYAVWVPAVSSIDAGSGAVSIAVPGSTNISVKVTRASGVTSSSDAISVTFNGTVIATATATYASQNIAINGATLAALMPTATSGTLTFTTKTTINGSVAGSASATRNFSLTGSGLKPTVSGSVTLTEMNGTISPWRLGAYIATKSRIKIDTSSLTVAPGTGASITGLALSASNGDGAFSKSLLSGGSVTVTPAAAGSITLRIVATDSRGQSSAQTGAGTLSVLAYNRPSVVITGVEYDESGDSSYTYTATVSTYKGDTANLATETSTFYLGTSTSPAFSPISHTDVTSGTYTRTVQQGLLQPKSTYTLTVAIKDAFNTAYASAGITTSTGSPVIDFFKDKAVSLFDYVGNDGHAVDEGLPDGFTVGGGKTSDLTGDVYVGKHTYLGLRSGAVMSTGENDALSAGTLPILYGGTGADAKPGAQRNLGLYIGNEEKPDVYFSASGSGASYSPAQSDLYAWESATLPVEMGGTGAPEGEQALVNLGLLDPNTTVSNVPQIYPKYGGGGSGPLAGALSSHTFTTTLSSSSSTSTSTITFAGGDGIALSDSGSAMTISIDGTVKRYTETSGGTPKSSYGSTPADWPDSSAYMFSYTPTGQNAQVSHGYGWRQRKWVATGATGGRLEQYVWFWVGVDLPYYWYTYALPKHFDSSLESFSTTPNALIEVHGISSGGNYRLGYGALQGFNDSNGTFTAVIHQNTNGSTADERYMVQVYFDGTWGN